MHVLDITDIQQMKAPKPRAKKHVCAVVKQVVVHQRVYNAFKSKAASEGKRVSEMLHEVLCRETGRADLTTQLPRLSRDANGQRIKPPQPQSQTT